MVPQTGPGCALQDLNWWKSPLCSPYCFQNPGDEVRGGVRGDVGYLMFDCDKRLGNCHLINEQDHFTKVSGNLNAASEYILPKHACIVPCPGEELKKRTLGDKVAYWMSYKRPTALLLAFKYALWEQSHPPFLGFSETNTPKGWALWRCWSLPFYCRGSLIWVHRRNWRQLTHSWDTVQSPYNDINRHSQLGYSVWDQDLACDGACLHFIICLWILTIIHHNRCNRLFKLKCCLTGKWSSRNVLQN